MRRRVFGLGVLILVCVPATVALAAGTSPPFVFGASVSHATVVPGGRVFGAGAAEPDGVHVLVYGGQDPSTSSNQGLGDTWRYDATHGWVAQCGTTTPATAPCPPGIRTGAGLATGPRGVVLYGGFGASIGNAAPQGDTWNWNGTHWTRICPSGGCGPGPRALVAMAGNGTNVVLFGGLTQTGPRNDTWVFNGTSWTQTCGPPRPNPCGPAPLAAASMAWDGTHFVLFGGTDPSGSRPPVDDTWVFNGTSWTKVCGTSNGGTACGPPARALGAFSFAPHRTKSLQGAILLVGGNLFSNSQTSTLYRDAWLWHAHQWIKLTPPWNGPPLTFPNNSSPPAGTAPLLGIAAPLSANCQVLFLGESIARTGTNPTVHSTTYIGGRDLTHAARPDSCTATTPATTTPTTTPVTTAAPANELPRTGTPTTPLAALGAALLCAGLLARSRAKTPPRRH